MKINPSDERTTEQILRDAAEAAKARLPEIEVERARTAAQLAETAAQLAELDAEIARYRMVASAGNPSIDPYRISMPRSPVVTSTSSTTFSSTSGTTFTVAFSDSEPSSYEKVGVILSAGGPHSAKALAEAYRQEYGETIPQSTLYYALNKGRESGQFVESDGVWSAQSLAAKSA